MKVDAILKTHIPSVFYLEEISQHIFDLCKTTLTINLKK